MSLCHCDHRTIGKHNCIAGLRKVWSELENAALRKVPCLILSGGLALSDRSILVDTARSGPSSGLLGGLLHDLDLVDTTTS